MAVLDDVKKALRVTHTQLDSDYDLMIKAGLADLGITDINSEYLDEDDLDPLVIRAVVTYCRLQTCPETERAGLKSSYDEQKAQLAMNSTYTDWGE